MGAVFVFAAAASYGGPDSPSSVDVISEYNSIFSALVALSLLLACGAFVLIGMDLRSHGRSAAATAAWLVGAAFVVFAVPSFIGSSFVMIAADAAVFVLLAVFVTPQR